MRYNYKLVRSRRKTISLTVSADNTITVRAPYRTSVEFIDNFLEKKSGWLDKKFSENKRNMSLFADVTEYRAILIGGKSYRLVVGQKGGVQSDGVFVGNLDGVRKVVIDAVGDKFLSRVNEISEATGLKPRSVSFKSYKSRWGCCDINGNIAFNYKLLMLPESLQDYVIVHELCHLKHMDHSPQFWELAKKIMPDCRARRKLLKDYNFLTRLYA